MVRFFVKGITNSNKADWSACYAADFEDLERVIKRTTDDPLLKNQALVIRQFVPLITYGVHPETQTPITKEYRCFIANGQLISQGYYWSEELDKLHEMGIYPDKEDVPFQFIQQVAERVADKVSYYVADIAETEDGWIVVELNDATMSGLAANLPDEVYQALARLL